MGHGVNLVVGRTKERVSPKLGRSLLLRKARAVYRRIAGTVARAGTTTPFSTGRRIRPEQANFDGNYIYGSSAKGVDRQKTVEIGSFKPNGFGLHDMHGNVWEWVEDCYQDTYNGAPTNGGAHRRHPGAASAR